MNNEKHLITAGYNKSGMRRRSIPATLGTEKFDKINLETGDMQERQNIRNSKRQH